MLRRAAIFHDEASENFGKRLHCLSAASFCKRSKICEQDIEKSGEAAPMLLRARLLADARAALAELIATKSPNTLRRH